MSNLTATVQSLYLAYDAGDLSVRPILADALEDAGNHEEAAEVRKGNMQMRSGATPFCVYSKRKRNGQWVYTDIGFFFAYSTRSADLKEGVRCLFWRHGCILTPATYRRLKIVEGEGVFPAIKAKHPPK